MSIGEYNKREDTFRNKETGNGQDALVENSESRFALSDPEKAGMSLAELMHARLDVPSPFMKEIFLLRQAIVGTRYLGGSDELVEDLKPGSRISFVAEPDNKYDEHAVMALDSRGRKLGYIPRHENGIIGALLKAGKSIYGIMPDEPISQGAVAPGSERTPYSLWVDLYMREFLLPDDMTQIPRQGYQGSYAVADFIPWDDDEGMISSIFVIKVINGNERGLFRRHISRDGIEEYREAIAAFQRFVGYLPIVSHDIAGDILPQLEEAYGVQLGMPFSNQVIDTLQMAANHLPWIRNTSLEKLAEALGVEVNCDTPEETRCRIIWKLYIRMERSELGKMERRSSEHVAEDAGNRKDAGAGRLDESIEEYPLSSMTRQVLRLNGIATLRELTRYTEDEINYMDYAVDENFRELMTALEREGVHPKPEDLDEPLYGYPDSMQAAAKEKGRLWEAQLLFSGIIVWYQWLDPVRKLSLPVWCAGEEAKSLYEKEDLLQWIASQLEKLEGFLEEIADTLNNDVKRAAGDFGERGDAQAIMDSIERLMEIYKRSLLWRQSFSLIDTKDDYRNPMEKCFFELSRPVFQAFDTLYSKSRNGMSLVHACLDGRIEAGDLELDLSVKIEIDKEEMSEIFHELQEA